MKATSAVLLVLASLFVGCDDSDTARRHQEVDVRGGAVILYTGSQFQASDRKTKEAIAGTVFSYYFVDDQSLREVLIREGSSGRKLGRYTKTGLELE
jgi:hypothetical protein